VARLALERAGCDPRRISTRHVDGVLRAARTNGSRLDLPDGVTAAVRAGTVRLAL
jgi:hypothetical protein